MLPPIEGRPIRVRVRASLGPHLAATSISKRAIALDRQVLSSRGDFERILVHEIFHFVWVRLSNAGRREWERLLEGEFSGGAEGELGWSAEWRKNKLARRDADRRSPKWRRYICESFCDTAAWRFAGLKGHEEFTLAVKYRRARRRWFEHCLETGNLKI
ncbi:MAG: hypothetical protein JO307_23380 [Bryobacterales bacterium]|nr:hypothetical protein [Bryobacterales bacterium]MBV9399001.1 hypothetical protein [Bryobacterales bacterium]